MANTLSFPDGFLWGAAGAAHQVEGGNINSDSWLLEHVASTPFAEPSGDACDHYHRYPEDIALLAKLGFNTYRFSVEWARIEPEEGEFSRAALDHYRRVLATCHEHNLTPIVTYHHFTSPRWFAARGGWEVVRNAPLFARYCERVTQHLGDLIGAACTINEPNVGLLLQMLGVMPPDSTIARASYRVEALRASGSATFAAFPHCQQGPARSTFLSAHRMAFEAIKSGPGDFPVGMTLAMTDMQAEGGGTTRRDRVRAEVEDVFLDAARADDFIGVQNYTRTRFGPDGPLAPEGGAEITQMGYEFWPEALEATIRYAVEKTGLPVIVTENGVATAKDERRIEFIKRAVRGVHRCIADGITVKGYCYWSMFDNFEWARGYAPTFGLIAVDHETQARSVKPSAEFLGAVARANALEVE